jgi:hypothetical protein
MVRRLIVYRGPPPRGPPPPLPRPLLRRIRLLEYVRVSRYATTGRTGLGLVQSHMGRAPQHRVLEGLHQAIHRSQLRWAGPSRTWTTNLPRHRDYGIGRPSGDFPAGPSLGRFPEQSHPPFDPPGYAILRGRGPEQRLDELKDSESDGSWRTKRRHVMQSSKRVCERDISRVWGFARLEENAAVQTTYIFEC